MNERLLECSFLIPIVRDSDKSLHQPIVWRDFQDDMRSIFVKGHSGPESVNIVMFYKDVKLTPGEYPDLDNRETVHDESRRYTVAIPESRLEDLRNLLRKVADSFDQKCIYLSVAGIAEFILRQKEKPI
ncbi:MAG: hypothetical protein HZB29_06220 [Nitrospinae bacterium]|nr:hypothetical protein [Nitrospinota bacterium]